MSGVQSNHIQHVDVEELACQLRPGRRGEPTHHAQEAVCQPEEPEGVPCQALPRSPAMDDTEVQGSLLEPRDLDQCRIRRFAHAPPRATSSRSDSCWRRQGILSNIRGLLLREIMRACRWRGGCPWNSREGEIGCSAGRGIWHRWGRSKQRRSRTESCGRRRAR